MRRPLVVLVGALFLAVACRAQPEERPSTRSLHNVITEEEIDSAKASNVYELIARLHAEFLRDRGRVSLRGNTRERAVVFINDQEYGIPESMRNLPPERFSEIRFFPGIDAVVRFGAQYGGGVIQLISRSQ